MTAFTVQRFSTYFISTDGTHWVRFSGFKCVCPLLARVDYSAPLGKRSIAMSVSVCPRAYLSNLVNSLHVTAVARFSTRVVAVCYVLPVAWMTPCLHIVARNRQCLKRLNRWQHGFDFAACTQADPSGSDSIGPRTDNDIYDSLVCV